MMDWPRHQPGGTPLAIVVHLAAEARMASADTARQG